MTSRPPSAPASDAPLRALIEQAWDLTYVDARRAGELGQAVLDLTASTPDHPLRGVAWFHVGFARMRLGDREAGLPANEQARANFTQAGDARGLLLCLEFDALHARVDGRPQDAMPIHERILAQSAGVARPPLDLYISCNSRAMTHKQLGHTDATLLDFYRAKEHAQDVPSSVGPRLTALANLGGYHADVFNLLDARALSEEAMALSEASGAWTAFAAAAVNLVQACDGLQDPAAALAAAQHLLLHEAKLPAGMIARNGAVIAQAFVNAGELVQAERWLAFGAGALVGDGDGKSTWSRARSDHLLASGDAAGARAVAEERLDHCRAHGVVDAPYARMKLLQAATNACEALGDTAAALGYLREAQTLYETLVGSGAQARFMALQVAHDVNTAQRDRDHARHLHDLAERDRQDLARLNAALEQKVAEADALQAQLREQAVRDALTGLHNRRYLHEVGEQRLALACRQNAALAVALIDIDFFKQLNDRHGHDAGDAVLQGFAQRLKERLRRSDVICRYGGEEFVLLASDTTGEQAAALLTAVMDELREVAWPLEDGMITGITFSAGVASLGLDGTNLAALLRAADRRLYQAKAEGRARVLVRATPTVQDGPATKA